MVKNKLLILGVPRSGTTLLTSMIGAHPDIAMLNEDLSFAMHTIVSKPVVGNKLCIPNQIQLEPTLLSRISRRYDFRIYRSRSIISINEYLKDDDLKLIIILRDPRAAISSMMKRGNQTFNEAVYRWQQGTEISSTLRSREEDRTLLVSFEVLVQDPQLVMEAVCEFSDIEFDAGMLEGWKGHSYSNRGRIQTQKAHAGKEVNLPRDLQEHWSETHDSYVRLQRDSVGSDLIPEL